MDETNFSDIKQDVSISEITSFTNQAMLARIINKLADYTDIITETKLSGIINHNYNLSSDQIKAIIEFLVNSRAISCIYTIAQKGSKDLNREYISNIFSNPKNPENSPAYLTLRNIMELRLTQQIQQFNINMGVLNAAKSMSLITLRNHAKLYESALETFSSVSPKIQHGYIAASLHDAYATLISRLDFWNDKMYMKFFFNEENAEVRNTLLTLRQEKKGISRINRELKDLLNSFDSYKDDITIMPKEIFPENNTKVIFTDTSDQERTQTFKIKRRSPQNTNLPNDPIMQTPFGKQYGTKINSIINEICSKSAKQELDVNATSLLLRGMYDEFCDDQSSITPERHGKSIIQAVDSILFIDTDIMNFSEVFLYKNEKDAFPKFFQINSSVIDTFLSAIFRVYFQERFKPILKFIKTDEMMAFACAFIIKRIYIMFGEIITIFGFFLIKAVAVAGKIQIGKM